MLLQNHTRPTRPALYTSRVGEDINFTCVSHILLNRGNYRGLKLIEQVMKVLERVVEGLIRQRVEIDEMQCGFMSGRGTTDAIFIVRQLQEKHLAANKPLYMAFVDLEKAFDRVPRDVIWWASAN